MEGLRLVEQSRAEERRRDGEEEELEGCVELPKLQALREALQSYTARDCHKDGPAPCELQSHHSKIRVKIDNSNSEDRESKTVTRVADNVEDTDSAPHLLLSDLASHSPQRDHTARGVKDRANVHSSEGNDDEVSDQVVAQKGERGRRRHEKYNTQRIVKPDSAGGSASQRATGCFSLWPGKSPAHSAIPFCNYRFEPN